ncbi:retrovirus-related pol polyprotein from transposon TNT 1-94, partial [Tanacetum coccineum]
MYFPPSFFDVMVHLVSHIVEEIKVLGPIFLHYIYLFERYMGFLKGYVRNRSRQEGSIVEGYVSEEVVSFCTSYIDGIPDIGVPESRHEGRLEGKGTIGRNNDKHQSIVIMEKPRKKRGINKIKDLPVGESMRFNKLGAAIGEYQHTFTSYRGNTVRKNISILKPNWHKIDVEEKELLWLDIK